MLFSAKTDIVPFCNRWWAPSAGLRSCYPNTRETKKIELSGVNFISKNKIKIKFIYVFMWVCLCCMLYDYNNKLSTLQEKKVRKEGKKERKKKSITLFPFPILCITKSLQMGMWWGGLGFLGLQQGREETILNIKI
jgi:hypothetical protein